MERGDRVWLAGANGGQHFGFLALKGDSRLKLFSQGFPKDNLPVPSAQLLAVASRRGVFAAVGPQNIIFGTTQSIRDAFRNGEGDRIDYKAEKTFPLPSKVSHIAFDAAEEHLIVGAEAGGVSVFSLNDVINSGSQPAPIAELALGGELREVRPNPAVESSKYVAISTANGDLRMLDLETKGFVNNAVLATNISTVCWSQRGKQIICGKFDGTCVQLTPSGEEKGAIPCVPGLDNCFGKFVYIIEFC
ncbi:hypothetical protein BJ508DRAFT_213587 [Ascobolus immersus RN42]|uniref:Nucleoporin Nup159/Nup146 N-terminal domain-containing protein n=1 Tax=Ascobolus immersus RN42 TaxID=1160509 RepID=A0A3N4HTE3_ASCIM|nr:hypothetical protein BJ508DRAFT_213587 [Ascobolus immersus RN42]